MDETRVSEMSGLRAGLAEAERLHREGKLPETHAIYNQLRVSYPNSPHAPARAVALLIDSNRFADAEPLINAGKSAFPDIAAFFIHYARLAERQREWIEDWTRFPDQSDAYLGAARALRAMGLHDRAASLLVEASSRLPHERDIRTDDDLGPNVIETTPPNSHEKNFRDLMMNFESLGGHGAACEFGLVQRNPTAQAAMAFLDT